MAVNTMANIFVLEILNMDLVHYTTIGVINNMKVNGKTIREMDVEYNTGKKINIMKASGKMI
jgi:hypothetical protein